MVLTPEGADSHAHNPRSGEERAERLCVPLLRVLRAQVQHAYRRKKAFFAAAACALPRTSLHIGIIAPLIPVAKDNSTCDISFATIGTLFLCCVRVVNQNTRALLLIVYYCFYAT